MSITIEPEPGPHKIVARSLATQARPPMVAIVGATGAVGAELLRCLEVRGFPLRGLRLLASSRSAGRTLRFKGHDVPVEVLADDSFTGVDIALAAVFAAFVLGRQSAYRGG